MDKDFFVAFSNLCKFLSQHDACDNNVYTAFNNLTGHSIKGFKTNTVHLQSYQVLASQYLSHEFVIDNLISNLYDLFNSQEFTDIIKHMNNEFVEKEYDSLVNICSILTILTNPNTKVHNVKLDSTQLGQLSTILKKLKDKFNTSTTPKNDQQSEINKLKEEIKTLTNTVQQLLATQGKSLQFAEGQNSQRTYSSENRLNKTVEYDQHVRKCIRKHLCYQNHLKVFSTHEANRTKPASLFHRRFPRPFLPHDQEFVDAHNNIIENCQNNLMTMIIHTLKMKLQNLEQDIKTFKNSALNDGTFKDQEEIDKFVKKIEESEDQKLKETFRKSDEKVKKMANKKLRNGKLASSPYEVITIKNGFSTQTNSSSLTNTRQSSQNTVSNARLGQQRSNYRFKRQHGQYYQNHRDPQKNDRHHYRGRSPYRQRSQDRQSSRSRQRSESQHRPQRQQRSQSRQRRQFRHRSDSRQSIQSQQRSHSRPRTNFQPNYHARGLNSNTSSNYGPRQNNQYNNQRNYTNDYRKNYFDRNSNNFNQNHRNSNF